MGVYRDIYVYIGIYIYIHTYPRHVGIMGNQMENNNQS